MHGVGIGDSLRAGIRLSPTIPPIQLPQTYYLLYFTTSLQKIPPPITPSLQPFPISIPSIYYHSLTNNLFIVFEFKKIIQYLYGHNIYYYHVTGLKRN